MPSKAIHEIITQNRGDWTVRPKKRIREQREQIISLLAEILMIFTLLLWEHL